MSGASWMAETRGRAATAWRAAPPPSRAAHLWRYTDPARLVPPPGGEEKVRECLLDMPPPPPGVEIVPLADAARSHPDIVTGRMGSLLGAGHGPLEALNLAAWKTGFLVRVPAGVAVEAPLKFTVRPSRPGVSAFRLLVVLEEGASATIIEEYPGGDSATALNSIAEFFCSPGARLSSIVLQDAAADATITGARRIRLEEGAESSMTILATGAGLAKFDMGAVLAGRGAKSESWGVVIADGARHLDHHTVHEHSAPSTTSRFSYRGILSGRARSVYTGAIRIAAGAPGCEAYQENRNLMLSDGARADSIPELEISNNDVSCTHGATFGPVDEEQLYYLATRGISRDDGVAMIVEGFVEPALAHLPGSVRELAAARVAAVLASA